MKEIAKIISLYNQIDFSKRKAALATVVSVDGSSYRRPGAKMLITDDGRWEGSISGGCLEGDALRKARQVMTSRVPMIVTYNTMDDRSGSLSVGLGCNGIIDIFIEPIDPEGANNPILLLKEFIINRDIRVVATVIRVEEAKSIFTGKKYNLIQGKEEYIPAWLRDEMRQILDSGKPAVKSFMTTEGAIDLFIERIDPGIEMVIFGAGYDAVPLAEMADAMGWSVTVSEDCIAHLSPKRFGASCKLVFAERTRIAEHFTFTERTAAVLLSHNYKYDVAVLEQLLPTNIAYIGILGPATRFEKMKSEMEIKGTWIHQENTERIHAPIGIDIGAETPEEIALSIISEIKAVLSNRSGGFLKNRKGPIHERKKESYYLQSDIKKTA